MKSFFISLMAALLFFSNTPLIQAEKAYITDSSRISLRRGPSTEHKILKFLPSGQPVEVLESEEGWSRIQLLEKDETTLSGWVLSHFLIFRLPWEDQVKALTLENINIKKELSELQKKLEITLVSEKNLTEDVRGYVEALHSSQREYASLKKKGGEYINLKTSYEQLQKDLKESEIENQALRNSQRNKWFATGALILLCGLMIGLLVGRQEKKRRSYY